MNLEVIEKLTEHETDVFNVLSQETSESTVLEKIYIELLKRGKLMFNYRFNRLFDFIDTFIMIITYYLLSFIINPTELVKSGYLADYFTFSVIGIAFQHYVTSSIRGISFTIRREQRMGTIESLLSTQTSPAVLFIGDSLFYFLYSTAFLVLALTVGALLGATLQINIATMLSVFIVTVLLVTANISIGIMSAAVIIKVKEGEPIGWAITWINQFLSGVFFPISLLPPSVKALSYVIPLTSALDANRKILMFGYTVFHPGISGTIIYLLVYIIVAYPIAILMFNYFYDRTRKEGALSDY